MGLEDEVLSVIDGEVVSTMISLLLPRDPAAPGDGRVSVALFVAASRIVPLFKANAEVEI